MVGLRGLFADAVTKKTGEGKSLCTATDGGLDTFCCGTAEWGSTLCLHIIWMPAVFGSDFI